jgi:D-alanine-D-alanine ligase-like ATP-grasp enzyme
MLWRLIEQARHRAQFYLNVPELVQILAFKNRRRAFWTRYWRRAAANISASFTPLEAGYFRIERDGVVCFARDGQVPLDSHLTLEIMGDKVMCNALLAEWGAPVIPYAVFSMDRLEIARRFFNLTPGQVVIKPASGTGGGRGVTTGISNPKALKAAARFAARYDRRLLVEREISARSYRLLFVGGKFVDAVLRDPPVVVGDGKRTIGQLVRAENKHRLHGSGFTALSPLRPNPDYYNCLREQGLTPRFVPAAGARVAVKGAVNENDKQGNHNARAQVHGQTIAMGEQLVHDLGVDLAGVDLLCADVAQPLTAQNGYVTEINTTPGLQHHFLIDRAGARTAVGETVLEYMLAGGSGTMRLGGGVKRAADSGITGSVAAVRERPATKRVAS